MAATSDHKWALITGVSAGGLGDALAAELMSRGINVIATALELDMLDYLRPPSTGASPVALEKLQLNVTDSTSIAAATTEASRITNGKLDYLFNNAGYGYMMPLLDADVAAVKRNFDVNVFGLLAVTQAFFPLLREAKGVVVNQCSIAGLSATVSALSWILLGFEECRGEVERYVEGGVEAVWRQGKLDLTLEHIRVQLQCMLTLARVADVMERSSR